MKKILTLILFVTAIVQGYAQDDPPTPKGSFGIGFGLDYGGIGGKISIMPSKNFALFAGLGYNFAGAGFNGGGIVRLSPDKRVCPTLTAMYGYNAAIRLTGDVDFSEIYFGPSIGFGLEFHRRNNPSNFWNLEILIPFRSSEYQNDIDDLQNNLYVDVNDLLPFTISVGYHFGF